jgi:hypothetical protein
MFKNMNNKTKYIALGVIAFVAVAIFVGFLMVAQKAQACEGAPECYPNTNGYCEVTVNGQRATSANIGQTVTFTGYGQGGTNYYAYSWAGDEGLTGGTKSVSKTYSTAGTKSATVRITSNGQSVYKTCSIQITNPQPPQHNLNVVCIANPSQVNIGGTVTYTSTVTGGGEAPYVYSWTGTDGLTGNTSSVSKTYTTAGSKLATVTVTSGNQTRTATCNSQVTQPQQPPVCTHECYPNVGGYCEVSVSEANIGQTVTFTGYGQGGTNYYAYSWAGDEGLTGGTKSVSKTYSTAGTKSATVRITSNGQSVYKTCSVVIKAPVVVVPDFNLYCIANPTQASLNQNVTYTAYPSGGSGSYSYSWTGTDNLYGNTSSIYKSYQTPGTKSATVTVYSGNQTRTATCNTNIQQAHVYVPPTQGGVYLDTIPATGISGSMKTALFMSGTILWSAFLGYLFIRRRNMKLAEQRMIDEAINS